MKYRWKWCGALLLPAALWAQDTWLVPAAFPTVPGQSIELRLAASEAFLREGTAVPPEEIARFTIRTKSGTRPVEGYHLDGKSLVAEVIGEEGQAIVAAETKPRVRVLEPKAFNAYLRKEELKPILTARREKQQSNSPGRERSRKAAKTILCVGRSRDKTYRQPEGLWLEIMPEENPCGLRVGNPLTLRVLWQGKPLPRVAVAAGYEGMTARNSLIWVRTDKNGRFRIPFFDRPGAWFVRALYMVRARGDPEADWHSATSTLTFGVQK